MNLKNFHQSIPNWIMSAEIFIGEQFITGEKIEGGTSTEIWYMLSELNHEYAVRKRIKGSCDNYFIENIKLADNDGFLPQGFKACEWNRFFLSYYNWVNGQTYSEYKIQYEDIIRYLCKMHEKKGYYRGVSSYANIIDEAKNILKILDGDWRLTKFQKKLIRESALIILQHLSVKKLEDIFDNRGCLTHGDLKPKNIVVKDIGFQVIDWDKLCSVSPEFDIVYTAFTGDNWSKLSFVGMWYQRYIKLDIFDLVVMFLPHIYLIHDTYYYMCKGERYEYLIDEVFPLYYNWMQNKREVY